ncbi:hypothetical protein [Treponema endosymbiont of Eucomonympha sp.]|uniref:hypothetical protein n=1 Tax=Treponema endosymbiont of Eucomonympha sp. TaxID=1580831 RepID=UPI000A87194F|nr:hypothetical protein [Treponema endosymbiont of Eucomonympha sp.]
MSSLFITTSSAQQTRTGTFAVFPLTCATPALVCGTFAQASASLEQTYSTFAVAISTVDLTYFNAE